MNDNSDANEPIAPQWVNPAPQSFWMFVNNIAAWAVKNVFAGGLAIGIVFVIEFLLVQPPTSMTPAEVFSRLLSLLVLGISVLIVNTDFDSIDQKYHGIKSQWLKWFSLFVAFLGILLAAFLSPSPAINQSVLSVENLELLSYLVFCLCLFIAYFSHLVRVHARQESMDQYREDLRGYFRGYYNDKRDSEAKAAREAAKAETHVDGLRI